MKHWIVTFLLWISIFLTNAGIIPTPITKSPYPEQIHIVSKQAGIDITTQKVIHILGPITSWSVRHSAKEGEATQNLPGDRVVIINSPGGEVRAGQWLLDAILTEKGAGVRIVCVAVGSAHSMAFNILSFCDVKLATENTTSVVHKIAFGGIPPTVRATAKNLRKLADDLDIADEPYCVQNSKMMHLARDIYDILADAQYEWQASQLLEMHYLDGIATVGK